MTKLGILMEIHLQWAELECDLEFAVKKRDKTFDRILEELE